MMSVNEIDVLAANSARVTYASNQVFELGTRVPNPLGTPRSRSRPALRTVSHR